MKSFECLFLAGTLIDTSTYPLCFQNSTQPSAMPDVLHARNPLFYLSLENNPQDFCGDGEWGDGELPNNVEWGVVGQVIGSREAGVS